MTRTHSPKVLRSASKNLEEMQKNLTIKKSQISQRPENVKNIYLFFSNQSPFGLCIMLLGEMPGCSFSIFSPVSVRKG